MFTMQACWCCWPSQRVCICKLYTGHAHDHGVWLSCLNGLPAHSNREASAPCTRQASLAMATPALEAVLRIPEIAAAIDSCTELLPGTPATKENLKNLLDKVGEACCGVSLVKDRPRDGPNWLDGGEVFLVRVQNGKRPSELYVRISAPHEY